MNELNKELAEQVDADSCQGTNCGTTTGDHSSECLAEAAAGQGWELKPVDLCGRDCPIHKILAEQAEAERPEVVAFRYHCTNAEGEPLPGWFYSDDAGTLGLREPLMTVAQHERIVGALRAANAKLEKELAMARDAASKGNTARQQCGGMEMEIEELRAEAQALREQVKALQSAANSWQSGYDEGRRMGTKHRQSEVEQLSQEVAKLTQYNKSLNEENTRLLVDCEETDKELAELRALLN